MNSKTSVEICQPLTKKSMERYDALVKSAYALFLQEGYDHITLDNIIQQAGGSKSSIYKYFGNKEGLFKAVCDYHFNKNLNHLNDTFDDAQNFKQYLLNILKQTVNLYKHEENIAFLHLILSQACPNPEIVEYLHQKWCDEVQQNITRALEKACQLGIIQCAQPLYSSNIFWGILHLLHWHAILGVKNTSITDIPAYLDYSVEHFLVSHQYDESRELTIHS